MVSGRGLAMVIVAATLAACAATAPPPAQALVAVDPQTARTRITSFLKARGFAVTAASEGGLTASAGFGGPIAEFATCEKVIYSDPYGDDSRRIDWATPNLTSGSVQVGLTPASGGTAVTAVARFGGSFTNRFSFTAQTASCRSTGGLEQGILRAAAG